MVYRGHVQNGVIQLQEAQLLPDGAAVEVRLLAEETSATAKEDFLNRARRLQHHGRLNSALDVVYNHVDEMLLAGMFPELDDRLVSINCDDYSVDLLLAMLTITHAAKSHLPHRKDFYNRVEDSIRRRGELEDGLLYGLD